MVVKRKITKLNMMEARSGAESGGHPVASYEKPKQIEWVQQTDLPILQVLRQILEELKKLNAK